MGRVHTPPLIELAAPLQTAPVNSVTPDAKGNSSETGEVLDPRISLFLDEDAVNALQGTVLLENMADGLKEHNEM